MKAIVTGGAGFVGRRLAERLGGDVVTYDIAGGDIQGDICDGALLRSVLDPGDVVFHLAGIRAGQGEGDFDLAVRVNLDGSRAVLEACRHVGGVRLVFASTLAVFGTSEVDDGTRPTPRTTYGATKAAVELLVNDYARKGFVDGRVGRLATVIVRPDSPGQATSVFASAVIRETLAGRDYVLPVAMETPVVVIGIETAAECFVRLADVPAGELGDDRVVNFPNLAVTAGELAEAARRAGASGKVEERPDPAIQAIVGSWPRAARADRALELGLPQDENVATIVRAHLEDATI